MNKVFFLLSFCVLLACNLSKKNTTSAGMQSSSINKLLGAYQVFKIDSLDNFYLIYATKNDSSYKILSEKTLLTNCNKIFVTGNYDFVLQNAKDITITNESQTLKFYLFNVDCLIYNDSTKICIERSGNFVPALFRATNVKGLCFIKPNR